MKDKIEIFNKKQPVLLISLFMILIGSSALYLLIAFIYPKLPGFFNLKITAVVCIVALVIWVIVIVCRQSSRKKPGLVIDNTGITDHTNITSVGFIPWNDIISFEMVKGSFNHKMIVVKVKNPEIYINDNSKLSASRQLQYRQFGSPILITATVLEYDPQQLIGLLNDLFKKKALL